MSAPARRRYVFFASCPPGLEGILHGEMRALRFARIERQVGGVQFEGDLRAAWKANLHLRSASRVLLRLARFEARQEAALYAGARACDWRPFLRPEGTLRVRARCRAAPPPRAGALHSEVFIAQRVKDAIADRFRESTGVRPSVAPQRPELCVHAHLSHDRCTLLVDTSGESLHKRGWRRYQGRAPLSETLAAAMILASDWDRRAPLLDPFCGSGTLLVEAALMAARIPPGLQREDFAFRRWPHHDESAWQRLREEARRSIRHPSKLILRGWDRDPRCIDGARTNLRAAGLEDRVALETGDARDFAPRPGWNAWIITNPPWGERSGQRRSLAALYRRFGEILRARCAGYHLELLCASPELLALLAPGPHSVLELRHGGRACALLSAHLDPEVENKTS